MNQEKLYQLFEKSTVATVIFDTQRGIQYANPSLLQLFPHDKHDLKEQPFSLLVSSSVYSDFESCIASGQKVFYRAQVDLPGSAHTSFPADISIQHLSKQVAASTIFLATIYPIHSYSLPAVEHDITDPERLSEIQNMLSLFKKETRAPLSTLNILAERLLQLHPRSDQMPLLKNILQSSDQLQEIVEEVLLYSDLLLGRLQTTLQPFSLHDDLKQLEDKYENLAQEQGMDFRLLTDDDIPAILVGDALLIRQMLERLIACLFTFQSERSINIQVLLESKVASAILLRFSIVDLGTTAKQSLLLRQAFLYTSVKIPQEWAGVELDIVDRLAKLMGGIVSLESFPSHPMSIHITLPLTWIEDIPLDQGSLTLPATTATSEQPLYGLNLLYVEDIIPNHFMMEGLCSIWKVNLDTALNGMEALHKLQHNTYDIILMDLQMPLMNGFETAHRIRHTHMMKNSSIPIIAVSGSVSKDTIAQIKSYGMDDFISKPIKPDELYQKLLRLISS